MATAAFTGLAGAGVTALAGLGSAGASAASQNKANQANLEIARETNFFNERMMDKQLNYNKEMYERQLADALAYSDPSYQRDRLNRAGLNSALIMSGGSSLGSVSSVPSAQGISPASGNVAQMRGIDYSGVAQAMASAVGFYQQAQMNKANIGLTDAQREQIRIDNEYRARQNLASLVKLVKEGRKAGYDAEISRISSMYADQLQRNAVNQGLEDINKRHQEVINLQLNNAMQNVNLNFLPLAKRLEFATAAAQLNNMILDGRLTEKQIQHEFYKITETIARATKTQSEARSAGVQADVDAATKGYNIERIRQEMWKAINNSGADNPWQFGQNAALNVREKLKSLAKILGF